MAPQHSEPLVPITLENLVQLAKAKFCQELEQVFGGDFRLWLSALKRLEAKGIVEPGPHLDALHELIADLERLQHKVRVSDE